MEAEFQKTVYKDLGKSLKAGPVTFLNKTNTAIYSKLELFCKLMSKKESEENDIQIEAINTIMKNLNDLTLLDVRDILFPPLENKQADSILESLKLVDAPYLAPLSKEVEESTYTLVLDLDETLVHYYEVLKCI